VTGPTANQETQSNTKSESTPPKSAATRPARKFRAGDLVMFKSWTTEDGVLAATICHIIDNPQQIANLHVYTKHGGSIPAHGVPRDDTGQTPGSWRPRD